MEYLLEGLATLDPSTANLVKEGVDDLQLDFDEEDRPQAGHREKLGHFRSACGK